MFVAEIEYYKQLKLSGQSKVSPSPLKNNSAQFFFNAQNSYQKNYKRAAGGAAAAQNSTGSTSGSATDGSRPNQTRNRNFGGGSFM